eukprot:1747186-Rhodomonas_salina.4
MSGTELGHAARRGAASNGSSRSTPPMSGMHIRACYALSGISLRSCCAVSAIKYRFSFILKNVRASFIPVHSRYSSDPSVLAYSVLGFQSAVNSVPVRAVITTISTGAAYGINSVCTDINSYQSVLAQRVVVTESVLTHQLIPDIAYRENRVGTDSAYGDTRAPKLSTEKVRYLPTGVCGTDIAYAAICLRMCVVLTWRIPLSVYGCVVSIPMLLCSPYAVSGIDIAYRFMSSYAKPYAVSGTDSACRMIYPYASDMRCPVLRQHAIMLLIWDVWY